MVLATKKRYKETKKKETEIIINKPCHYLNLKHCEDINTTNKTKTKNYVTIIIEIKEILKNVIAPYLEKETTKTAFPESQFKFYQTQSYINRLFLIGLEILCSRIGLCKILPYAPCRYLVHKTYDRKKIIIGLERKHLFISPTFFKN